VPASRFDDLREFVEKLAEQHPPIGIGAADLTVKDPRAVRDRFGAVFTYLARVETEVERNVLELQVLMPNPTETDRLFYQEVWAPQELRHGELLDAVQRELGILPAPMDLSTVSPRIRVVGMLARLPGILDVVRLLYYLTGAATERSAVLAYSRLVDGLRDLGEHAIAETVIAPIRRQEPGHFAFYRMSAQQLAGRGLAPWQLHLARVLRRRTFGLVGVNDDAQRRAFGAVAHALGLNRDLVAVAQQVSLVERELLWARSRGMVVPDYVLAALRAALDTRGDSSQGRRWITGA
jgi:hypothetical protein